MDVSTQLIDSTHSSERTLLADHFSRIQSNDNDARSPTYSRHVRIGFGKSTLSSRTEIDEAQAQLTSLRHPTMELCLKPAVEKTLEVIRELSSSANWVSIVRGEEEKGLTRWMGIERS